MSEQTYMFQENRKFAEIVLPLPLDKSFHYAVPETLSGRVMPGVRVVVPFGKKRLTGYCLGLAEKAEVENVKDVMEVLDGDAVLSDELMALARWMSATYLCSLGEALGSIFPPALRPPKRVGRAKDGGSLRGQSIARPSLTDAQLKVVAAVEAQLQARTHGMFLLRGVTGSGKTEVYLALIEEALRQGRAAIFLLPEIALTPQFIGIVQGRFPGLVGIWHSKVPPGEKYTTWLAARSGGIRIMLGARSALFAPFKDLGLIVIDEEHEPSYKQEQKPSYQTRDAACERARLANASVVLGSATPSLEAYYRSQQGALGLLELRERIDARRLPPVKIIDTSRPAGRSKILSEPLLNALTRVLARREQSILFLNRRGFAPGVACRSCGEVIQCPHCSISLVYHSAPASLRCHYCDHRQPWPDQCPSCKEKASLSVYGAGTQKVEEELRRLFPQARLFRLDRDTASKKGVYEKVYEDFKQEEYDILLGTQMVVKGFDFPRVTLVGVIDADTALYLPDFRSAERTFQLITQVAGRCGRSSLGGEVIVQTRHPDHYALGAAQQHDYDGFYRREIELRRQLSYPPFTALVNIVVRGKKEERVAEGARLLADALLRVARNGGAFELLGPSPAARSRLQTFYRWQLILKGDPGAVLAAAREAKSCALPSGTLVGVDIDPQSTL